jgi:hypothetical protein
MEIAVAEEADFDRQDSENSILYPEPSTKRRRTGLRDPQPAGLPTGLPRAARASRAGPRDFREADKNVDPIPYLEAEFSMFTDASAAFPPKITPEIQRACLSDYCQNIDDAGDRESCGTCGEMVQSANLERILFADPILAGNEHEFDICAVEFHPVRKEKKVAVDLCSNCLRSIRASGCDSIPKFSAANDINSSL